MYRHTLKINDNENFEGPVRIAKENGGTYEDIVDDFFEVKDGNVTFNLDYLIPNGSEMYVYPQQKMYAFKDSEKNQCENLKELNESIECQGYINGIVVIKPQNNDFKNHKIIKKKIGDRTLTNELPYFNQNIPRKEKDLQERLRLNKYFEDINDLTDKKIAKKEENNEFSFIEFVPQNNNINIEKNSEIIKVIINYTEHLERNRDDVIIKRLEKLDGGLDDYFNILGDLPQSNQQNNGQSMSQIVNNYLDRQGL